jgi:hypothetical protein
LRFGCPMRYVCLDENDQTCDVFKSRGLKSLKSPRQVFNQVNSL